MYALSSWYFRYFWVPLDFLFGVVGINPLLKKLLKKPCKAFEEEKVHYEMNQKKYLVNK